MTEHDDEPSVERGDEGEESEELKSLLRGALRDEEEPPSSDILRGVQRRIRARSGGKFYADGWSTARHPPIATYLLTSLLMLAIVLLVYAVLTPTSGEPIRTPMTPAPVHILPPRH